MEADFSGYATKAGLKCSDGRTIMPEAFKHMDGKTVPLVWQHGHNQPDNVLGHAVLEGRDDGVYAYAYFNSTTPAQQAKSLVQHGDIVALSIYANKLVERSKQVFHGVIREVSLVLSGANPGALIDNISVQHSDGDVDVLDDEAIIFTGLTLEHMQRTYTTQSSSTTKTLVDGVLTNTRTNNSESTEMVDAQDSPQSVSYSDLEHDGTAQDVYDSLTDEQKNVVHYMIGAALEAASKTVDHSADNNTEEGDLNHKEGNGDMTRNVFEKNGTKDGENQHVLSHSDIQAIVADAVKGGSLKDAVQGFALQHGIENIEILFPDAKTIGDTPDFIKRRTEWVASVLNGTNHTRFSRIKTRTADLTHDEARAKGYIKGNMKKEEFFSVSQRVTTPTTVYKKQKIDRDDMIDITDFDVVVWLKGEMRLMLEEELARAILVGDGRAVDDEDKIKDPAGSTEGAGIRAIVNDHELYVTTVNVALDDADNNSYAGIVDDVVLARRFYKGSGSPTFYTTEETLGRMLLAKDNFGRRLYDSEAALATALRVRAIVPVEVMENQGDLVGVIVNLADYNVGADKGGEVNLFDDFDIDYNQYKYLIETRISGALTKVKSALVLRRAAAGDTEAEPVAPAFAPATNTVTIPTTTGVVYQIGGVTQAAGDKVITEDTIVDAVPATGYYFATNAEDQWLYEFQA